MSKRRDADLVEDISEAITRIERYTDIVWDVLQTKLPELRRHLAAPEETKK